MRARTPGRHAVAFVAIIVAIDTIGFGLIMPVMPTLLTELTGETVNRAAIYGGWLAFVRDFATQHQLFTDFPAPGSA